MRLLIREEEAVVNEAAIRRNSVALVPAASFRTLFATMQRMVLFVRSTCKGYSFTIRYNVEA